MSIVRECETFEIAVPYAHLPLFQFVAGKRDTAFAVDVGTTTVVVLLVVFVTGEVLSRAGAFNEQIRLGTTWSRGSRQRISRRI